MSQRGGGLRGREAYECDLAQQPNYPDGSPRPDWDDLGEVQQWSWARPYPRLCANCLYEIDPGSEQCLCCGTELA